MKDAITPEAPSSSTFTELNVRQEKGKPHFIRLHDSVVKRLERQLAENPASTGLLLGSIESNQNCTIAVELYEPTTRLEDLIRARKSGTPKVVGYYRSHSRENFALEPPDRALFARCFPNESRLVLLVKPPKADVGTAMFFLGENGLLAAERATVEFPLNLRELGAEEPPAAGVAATAAVTASASASPAVPTTPGSGGLLWKIAVSGVVVIACVFGLGELHVFDPPDSQPAAKQTVEQQPAAVPPGAQTEVAESQPAKPSKPEPAKPTLDTTVNNKAAGPAAPPKSKPTLPAPSVKRNLAADISAPKSSAPVRQQPAPTAPAPVSEAQLRPVTPPPVNTEQQSNPQTVVPSNPVQSPKPVVAALPYTPPNAIWQLAPVVPEKVRRSITGEVVVRVRVKVDASGKVIGAEPVGSGAPVAEALTDSALSAVKRWKFEPARRGGDKVPGEIVLSFAFRK